MNITELTTKIQTVESELISLKNQLKELKKTAKPVKPVQELSDEQLHEINRIARHILDAMESRRLIRTQDAVHRCVADVKKLIDEGRQYGNIGLRQLCAAIGLTPPATTPYRYLMNFVDDRGQKWKRALDIDPTPLH